MGSTSQNGERCIYRLLIWSRIDYRQNDAQEFLLPSYLHFVWVLEVPCAEIFVCFLFVDDVYLFIVKNCDASIVTEHAD